MPAPSTTAFAWVESPLQLVCAVEYAAASDDHLRIVPRAGALQLPATVSFLRRLGLPANVSIERPRLSPRQALGALRGHWIFGDPFSGHARSALAIRAPRRLTLLDDGASSLLLDAVLLGAAPLERPERSEPGPLRALGSLARGRLVELAERGVLELFSCYPLAHAALVENDFAWLRSRTSAVRHGATPSETTAIILGSAAVTDGVLDVEEYLRWLARQELPARYFPHRREHKAVLERVAAIAGIEVEAPGLPIELVLAGSRGVRVTSLPSSALDTLAIILRGTGAILTRSSISAPATVVSA